MKELLVIPRRLSRMKRLLAQRQPDLRLFMENVVNYHNVSAILRTADAVGVLHVHYFHSQGRLPINDAITCGAHKWLCLHLERDVSKALTYLKKEGYQLVATALCPQAIDFREIDYTHPTLIIVGHELEGVSSLVLEKADIIAKIPMHGMVQSLNVSVATAVILYEAERQRRARGLYDTVLLSEEEIENLLNEWAYKRVIQEKARGRCERK